MAVNAMGADGSDSIARLQQSAGHLRQLLSKWYDDEKREGRHHAVVPHISWKMLGEDENHTLGVYGEQTCGLLRLTPVLLQHFGEALAERQQRQLTDMGKALIGTHTIITRNKEMGALPMGAQQDIHIQHVCSVRS